MKTAKFWLFLFLPGMVVTTSSMSQKLSSDIIIKDIRTKYNLVNQWIDGSEKEDYKFNYGSAYIDDNGDTIYEGEGEERIISVYTKDNRIIRITDVVNSYEGESRINSTEFTLYNDTLIFVFKTQNARSYNEMGEDGYFLQKNEDRIYFKNQVPYYHLNKTFVGYSYELTDFNKDVKNTEVKITGDEIYLNELRELTGNYLNKTMNSYKRVITRL